MTTELPPEDEHALDATGALIHVDVDLRIPTGLCRYCPARPADAYPVEDPEGI